MRHAAPLLVALLIACDTPIGDQSSDASHSALGPGNRLRDVQNPKTTVCNGQPCAGQTVNVTTVVVTAVDTFDETHNGKSKGTVFVQDGDVVGPLAGISLYAPTFIPANLRVAPGDVVNMTGQYTEQHTIGSTVNFGPDYLPQMNKPQVSPAFEQAPPVPLVLKLTDLATFDSARPYLGMLIELDDITVPFAPAGDGTGRVHAALTTDPGAPSLSNELWDLRPWVGVGADGGVGDGGGPGDGGSEMNSFPPGTHFTKVVGILDFFFGFFVCPRTAADLIP